MESSVTVAPPNVAAHAPSPLRNVDELGVPDDAILSTLSVPEETLDALRAVKPAPDPRNAVDVSAPVFGLKYSFVDETVTAVSFPLALAGDNVG